MNDFAWLYRFIRAHWRIAWGWCPECNSDAPDKYQCQTCMSMDVFSMARVSKARVLYRYLDKIT